MKILKHFIFSLMTGCILMSTMSVCAETVENSFFFPEIVINPNKRTPLSAYVKFETQEPSEITIKIHGKDGAKDIVHTFEGYNLKHQIPILGLYAGRETQVDIYAKSKTSEKTKTIFISIPQIRWNGLFLQTKKDDANPVNWFISDGIVLDENAELRYIFDGYGERVQLAGHEVITENRINGLKRYSMLGDLLQTYSYPEGFVSFSHGITQRPNRNFLIIGSYKDAKAIIAGKEQQTQRDFILEIDYKTGEAIDSWDVAKMLNPDRTALVQAGSLDYGLDNFCHLNSVQYNKKDDSVVCSCRSTGVFKVFLKEKKLAWLITPNIGLDKSGRDGKGGEISSKVLKAVDLKGRILSEEVQKGYQAHKDFKWPTSTHHVRFWGDGYVSVFDNSGPVFDKKIVTTDESFASVYKVDEKKGTVKHVFKSPEGCLSGPAGSVLLNDKKDIVTSFVAQCRDKSYKGVSYGYIRSYDFKTKKMRSEIFIYKGGAAYYYEIWPFEFYQKTGGMYQE